MRCYRNELQRKGVKPMLYCRLSRWLLGIFITSTVFYLAEHSIPSSQAQFLPIRDRLLMSIQLEDDVEALRELDSILLEMGPEHDSIDLTRYLRVLRRSRSDTPRSEADFEDIEILLNSGVHGAAFHVPAVMGFQQVNTGRLEIMIARSTVLLWAYDETESWIVTMILRVLMKEGDGQRKVGNWTSIDLTKARLAIFGGSPTANLIMLQDGEFQGDELLSICRRIAFSGPLDRIQPCHQKGDGAQISGHIDEELSRQYSNSVRGKANKADKRLRSLACDSEAAPPLPQMVCTDVLSAVLAVCLFNEDGDDDSRSEPLFVCNERDILDVRQANEEVLSSLAGWTFSAN